MQQHELCEAIHHYLRRCFEAEDTPRVSELAEILGVTRERLSRQFAAAHGMALSAYLKSCQLDLAQQLLIASELTTTRIAYQCGFGTRRTFHRAFRRATGMSPDQYRRKQVLTAVTKCL
jgi:two-component system response regulator YesN